MHNGEKNIYTNIIHKHLGDGDTYTHLKENKGQEKLKQMKQSCISILWKYEKFTSPEEKKYFIKQIK